MRLLLGRSQFATPSGYDNLPQVILPLRARSLWSYRSLELICFSEIIHGPSVDFAGKMPLSR